MAPLDPVSCVHPVTGAVRPVTPNLLAETYLCPRADTFDVEAAIAAAKTAPWTESHAVAPAATVHAVTQALREVIEATPGLDPANIETDRLPDERARHHLKALRDLWVDLGSLPEPLVPLAHALGCTAADALESLPLLPLPVRPGATAADLMLADLLRSHHGVAAEAETHVAAIPGWHPAATDPALKDLQASLTDRRSIEGQTPLTVHALRDPVQELSLAAGMARHLLDEGLVDTPEEIGLLIPEDAEWLDGVEAAFDTCGLRLGGLPGREERDAAGEVLHLVLTVLRKPAPGMAILALHALLPDTRFPRAKEILESRPMTERDLAAVLRALADLARGEIASRLVHLAVPLGSENPIDWDRLPDAVRPVPRWAEPPARRLGAVSVFPAGRTPWRVVRRLIGVGFAGDRYPGTPAASPFWLEPEIDEIERCCGLRLPGRRAGIEVEMARLTRQLSAVTDGIDLLLPRRNRAGASMLPSPALDLIARRCGISTESLIRDLGRDSDAWPCAARPVAPCPHGGLPALPAEPELRLGRDLTKLRLDDQGAPKPQSPSRLETLLVSPLAWLLEELGARDESWAPDDLDILVQGNVLHAAFERLFPPGPPPTPETVRSAAPVALDAAIEAKAPFLAGSSWAVERAELLTTLTKAAEAWARLLAGKDVAILATEERLSGEAFGLPLHGVADVLLREPSGLPVVIDYKASSSSTRRKRLEGGWDLQARLYGDMLPSSDLEVPGANMPPIVGYFTLKDGRALLGSEDGPEGFTAIPGDTHAEALARIESHVTALREGRVSLNRVGDAKMFKDAGVGTWAIEHPVVMAFLREDEE